MLAGNILLVEDARTIGRQLVDMLDELGHNSRWLDSAERGLEVFSQRSFDVVLSDVYLPGMDGIEMVRRMRQMDPLMSPIIMTGHDDQKTAVRALETGVRIFLRKPIQRPTLRSRLQEALQARRQETERRSLFADLLRARADLQQTVVAQHRRLALTKSYLDDLLDAAPFAIISTDREGRILTLNSTAQRLYQRSEPEVLGHDVGILLRDTTEVAGDFMRCTHQRPDGSRFPVLMRQRRILDHNRQHIARLYVIEDLSEAETLRAQLQYAEQLSVLGQMAPRIAHEIKTPLQLVCGYTELAMSQLESDNLQGGIASLRSVQPAAEDLSKLVEQLAKLGRPQQSGVQSIDLSTETKKVLEPMQQLGLLKYCTLHTTISADVPEVLGDAAEIEQVLRNLVMNAVQAMEGRDQRQLCIELKTDDRLEQVYCRIQDTGSGIPAENLERIFEPFFTTKEHGRNTGLGLPIVKSILDRMDARLRVESEVGRGTCFEITFPAHEIASSGDAETAAEDCTSG